jgi:2-polyprenyl-3-methyl-5-hydroxy-6-metoxy-1,4-benzoquinol methylase
MTRAATAEQAEMTRAATAEQAQLNRKVLTMLSEHVHDWNIDKWRINELEGLVRYFRRREYLAEIAAGKLVVPTLDTSHPVAFYSNDTIHPRGCKNDNSIAPRFNRKLYQLLADRPQIRVLDIGCAGGGLVRSLLDDGHFAVGLEGSDFPLVNQSGEWSTIPQHLFTCDATQPFTLSRKDTGEPLLFDAVTAWELMEHIPEDRLPGLIANLDRHLAPGGYMLFSIATFLDWNPETGVIWHVTVKPQAWWLERFRQFGFTAVPTAPFGRHDWLRGSGLCRFDWTEEEGMGFHVLLRRTSEIE